MEKREAMMTVGVLTWFNREQNCGQTLQAYALQHKLSERLADKKVVLINYQYMMRQAYCHHVIWRIYNVYKAVKSGKLRKYKKFNRFIRSNMNSSKVLFTEKDMEKYIADEDVKAIVLGSDQIWNPQSGEIPNTMLLDFSNKVKKISYSPSMCAYDLKDKYSDEIRKIARKIETYDFVGVREIGAKMMLEEYTSKEINVLLDPVFLIDKDEWMELSNPKIQLKDKYILVYCVGEVPDNVVNSVERVKTEKRIDRVCFIKNSKFQKVKKDWDIYDDVGPREFITIVSGADYIFCDSFHMTAFAIIFRKNFYVFSACFREYIPNHERVLYLLERFGLSGRYARGDIKTNDIDYGEIEERIAEEIKCAKSEFEKICCIIENNK